MSTDDLIERLLLAAEREDSALHAEAAEALGAMRKDACRYEFLREHWGQLITSCAVSPQAQLAVVLINVNPELTSPDPQTLDQAIDAAIEREEENERAAAIGDRQDDLSGPAAQRRGL